MPISRAALHCLLLLVAGMSLPEMAFAELEKGDAPITLVATPQVAAPGATITLSGETPFVTTNGKAKITIVPPGTGAAPVTIPVDVNKDGKYSLAFKNTQRTGFYGMAVHAPDGKGKANGSFRIVNASDAASVVADTNADIRKTEAEGLQKITTLLQQVPDASGKDEALQKLDQIKQKYNDLDAQRDKVQKALAELAKAHDSMVSAQPPGPGGAGGADGFGKAMGDVAQQWTQFSQTSAQTRAQFAKTESKAEACDMLDNAIEMFNLLSTLSDLEGDLMGKLVNVTTDKVIPAVIDTTSGTSTLEGRTAMSESQKILATATQGYEALSKSIRNLFGDVATYALKKMYDALCTRFEGPVDAVFTAHMSNENSEYWSYSMHLVGKVVLSEPKSAGNATGMSGYISGNAVDYDVKEDALQLDPRLRQKVLYHELIAPKSLPKPAEENGTLFNLKSPFAFYIRIKATRDGDKLTFKVGDASKDLSDTFNRGIVYYVFNAGIMPMLVHQNLPMQNAQFVFSRGIHVEGSTPTVTITKTDSSSQFEQAFTRDVTTDSDQIKVHWDVKVKGCSPSCTKSTLDKMKDLYNGK